MFEFITDRLPDFSGLIPDFEMDSQMVIIIVMSVVFEVLAWFLYAYWQSRGIVSLTRLTPRIVTHVGIPFVCYFIIKWQAGKAQ
jgi:hypothetical protein